MRLRQRIISLVLAAITILTTLLIPITPAYASGGVGDGLGDTSATGGTSEGTWAASRTGIRVYVVDETGALMSNIVDIVSNTQFPSYNVEACFGTRGIGTHQYYLKDNFGIGAYSSTANIVGGKNTSVLIISDDTVGLGDLLPIQTYSHGCCGSCDPPCGSCHGHTCKLEMPGRNGDNKLKFVFDQINAEQSLQVKTGVHSDTDPKVYIPNGQHPETIGSMYASDNVYEYVSDGNQKNGAELVTVLWRGGANPTDIPTLAKYKQTDIQNRYGSANWQIPQAMLKNASNTSHKTRATGPSVNSLSITFGIDQGASDLYGTASCVTHNGYNTSKKEGRQPKNKEMESITRFWRDKGWLYCIKREGQNYCKRTLGITKEERAHQTLVYVVIIREEENS